MGKFMKEMKFDDILKNRVDMDKVDFVTVKPWISKRITELNKNEDEVLIDYIYNQLEPKYPDPKEIQNNLSGFLSFKNARIFTGELWQQLINSMESSNTMTKENPNSNNDKIKSFPRLGPTENKQINTIVLQNKSSDKKESRHYRLTGSRSDSFSSGYSRSRSRSIETYKYRDDQIYRSETRSRTQSSSSYTPYRRYSNYTDSYEESPYSCRSSSHHNYNYKRRSFSSSSISIIESVGHNKPVPLKPNGLCFSTSSGSIIASPVKELHTSFNEFEEVVSKKSLSDYSHSSDFPMNNFKNVSSSPKGLSSVLNSQTSSSSSSMSIAFFSPGNLHLHEMSPATDTSSSDYTIEFMDKNELGHSDRYMSDDESESDVEWITIEELHMLKSKEFDVSCYSSPTNSYSTSEYSTNDIEWIEENQLDQLSNKYFLI